MARGCAWRPTSEVQEAIDADSPPKCHSSCWVTESTVECVECTAEWTLDSVQNGIWMDIDRHCSFQGISLSYHCHLDNFGHLDSNISEHSISSATAAAICQESSPHWASIQTPPSSMQQDPPQSWNRVRHGCSYPPHRSRDRKLRKPTRDTVEVLKHP